MPQEVAEKMMERIPAEWHKHTTEWGTLYYAEYDWLGEVVDGEYKTFPPRLKNGSIVRTNRTATKFFNEHILGECFLFPRSDKRNAILNMIVKCDLHYSVAS